MEQFTNWRKSSHSADQGNCVEVAATADTVGVRDTKDRAAGHFTVSQQQWHTFISHIASEHDQQQIPLD